MVKALVAEIQAWLEAGICWVPGHMGHATRRLWFKRRFLTGDNVSIGTGCKFVDPKAISIEGAVDIGQNSFFSAEGGSISVGNKTAFNMNVHINASVGGAIRLGAWCLVGPNVVMRTANHRYDNPELPIRQQGHSVGDIRIDDDVWIGANAVVLGDVHIGRGAIVGAGAVVTKSVPPMAIVGGVPARVIRFRGQEQVKND